jgi:hypothetical protein
MSSSKPPEVPKPDTGSGWPAKLRADPRLGGHWRATLTPEEVRAMEAEGAWAVYAKTYDVPGPTRVKVHVNRRGLPKAKAPDAPK